MSTPSSTRLLLVDTKHDTIADAQAGALPSLLGPRDLLVVNDAATLPASLSTFTDAGEPVEVRLLEAPYEPLTRAVLLGEGDYRTPTELRAPPPRLVPGAKLHLAGCVLHVEHVSSLSPRLVTLRWPDDAASRFALVYRAGRPVQYSYVPAPLALWDVQTTFASRPWAVEMPSAARPLSGAMLLALRARGVPIVQLTHAAGLSATGDVAIDAALPLPERYDLPAHTVQAIERTRARGGRVVAVGTSVVRALEDSVAVHGKLIAGEALATLVLDAHTRPRVVSGLLTGIHVPGESHFRLLSAFTRSDTLQRAARHAEARGYRAHELGDAALFLPELAPCPGCHGVRAA